MRSIIRGSLESGGHEILDEADNGADGVELYKKLGPDFVTMDITMGGKDGIKAVEEILEHDGSAKILVVSALNEFTIKKNEPSIRAAAFITKPFEPEELVEQITKLLAS